MRSRGSPGGGSPRRPTAAELTAAASRTVPDLIQPGLKVLFCGINPGLYSAWAGHHFARPGNRFWPALFAGGFTSRLLGPDEEHDLLCSGYGITNMVERATLAADELEKEELLSGAQRLKRKVERYRPRVLAVLGLTAYRVAFSAPQAAVGLQTVRLGPAEIYVLPNPSGLNAHFTPISLATLFSGLRQHVQSRRPANR